MTSDLSYTTAGKERESSARVMNGMKKKMLQRYITTTYNTLILFRDICICIYLSILL